MSDSLNPNTQPELSNQDAELLSAYIDGMLSDSEKQALEARLAEDAFLRGELEAMRQTVALINALPTLKAPRDFTITAEDVAQTEPSSRTIAFPKVNWWAIGSAAAMILLVVGILPVLLRSNQNFGGDSPAADSAEIALQATQPPQETAMLFSAATATTLPTQLPMSQTNDARSTSNTQAESGNGASAIAMPSATPEIVEIQAVAEEAVSDDDSEEEMAADEAAFETTVVTDSDTQDQSESDFDAGGDMPPSANQSDTSMDDAANEEALEMEADAEAEDGATRMMGASAPQVQSVASEPPLILQFLEAMRQTIEALKS